MVERLGDVSWILERTPTDRSILGAPFITSLRLNGRGPIEAIRLDEWPALKKKLDALKWREPLMPDDRALHDERTGEIRRLVIDCETHFYEIGLLLIAISEAGSYRLDGYASLREYIVGVLDRQQTQALLALRIARNFSRELALQFRITKCDAWLRRIKVTPEEDVPADIARATVLVIAADGTERRIPLMEATVAQIDAETDRLKGPDTVSPEAARLMAILVAALAAWPGAEARVTATGRVTLAGLPSTALCAILAASLKALECG